MPTKILTSPFIRALALILCLCASPDRLHAQSPQTERVTIALPAHDGYGAISMQALLYKPEGKGPFPTVLYSHGRAGKPEERAALKNPINPAHAQFWLDRGVAVLAPIRPGYGPTGGEDRESSGARITASNECSGAPNVERSADQAVFAVNSALQWLRQQNFVAKNKILLEGQSVGGMTTVHLASQNPQGVVGFINFAGGTAGYPDKRPGQSCAVDQLRELFRKDGQKTRLPNLWLYAQNDQYWGEQAPRLWHQAFAKGGSKTKFVQTGPVPAADGHMLITRGRNLWSEPLLAFLAEVKF
jgi:dienelactone hydrolase